MLNHPPTFKSVLYDGTLYSEMFVDGKFRAHVKMDVALIFHKGRWRATGVPLNPGDVLSIDPDGHLTRTMHTAVMAPDAKVTVSAWPGGGSLTGDNFRWGISGGRLFKKREDGVVREMTPEEISALPAGEPMEQDNQS